MMSALLEDGGLKLLLAATAAAGALWLLLGLFSWRQRRTYNLTLAESAPARPVQPDFLKNDHARREAAFKAGAAPAAPPPPPPPRPSSLLKLSGLVALLASLASFAAAAFGVLQHVEEYDKAALRLASGDGFVAMVWRHPAGFAIAAAIIVFQLALLIRRMSKNATP